MIRTPTKRHIKPQQALARAISQLTEAGGDPYNSADTLKVTRDQAQDFAEWASGNGLAQRQAE